MGDCIETYVAAAIIGLAAGVYTAWREHQLKRRHEVALFKEFMHRREALMNAFTLALLANGYVPERLSEALQSVNADEEAKRILHGVLGETVKELRTLKAPAQVEQEADWQQRLDQYIEHYAKFSETAELFLEREKADEV